MCIIRAQQVISLTNPTNSRIRRVKLSAASGRSFVDTTSSLLAAVRRHGVGLLERDGHRPRSFAASQHAADVGAHDHRSHHRAAPVRSATNAVRLLQSVPQPLQQSVSQPVLAGQSVRGQPSGHAAADARPRCGLRQRVLQAYVNRTAGQSAGILMNVCERQHVVWKGLDLELTAAELFVTMYILICKSNYN